MAKSTFVFAVLFALVPFQVRAADDLGKLGRISYPRTVGRWVVSETKEFENPKLGIAVTYTSPEKPRMTLYVFPFPARSRASTDAEKDALALMQWAGGVRELQESYPDVELLNGEPYDLPEGKGVLGDLRITDGLIRNASFLYLGRIGDWYVKVRYTGPDAARESLKADLDLFLKTAIPLLPLGSTVPEP